MKFKHIYLLLQLVCLSSCTETYKGTTFMSFENIKYVTSFENEHLYKKSDAKKITSSYGKNFRIIDRYLIEETGGEESFWRVTDLQTGTIKVLAHQGHGEFEFMSNPRLNEANIYTEGGEVHCMTNDLTSGKTLKINISHLFEDSVDIRRGPQIAPSAFNALIFSDSTYMYRTISKNERQQTRYVFHNRVLTNSPSIDILNNVELPAGEDFNILSSIMAYNKNNGFILEAPVCLNTINIYNIDGNMEQSICYGTHRWSVQDVLRKARNDRFYTFENPRIYDNCCAVLWLGDTRKSYFDSERNKASILLFGLDGKGLAKFDFDFMISYFEIDTRRYHLYVRDYKEGCIYTYNYST